MHHPQMALGLSLASEGFSVWQSATANAAVEAALKETIASPQGQRIYIYGREGSGRSHLLQACAIAAVDHGRSAQYINMRDVVDFPPEAVLDAIADVDLLCMDDLDAVVGHEAWELALFSLYNQKLSQAGAWLAAAAQPPQSQMFELADLASRLSAFTVFQLHGLDDEGRRDALILRASQRGIQLDGNVADFIVQRYSRDENELFQALDELDRHSLVRQRRLTIPFVKTVLSI